MMAHSADSGPMPHADITLTAADCTACLICVRECPTWCIDLTSTVEEVASPNARRPRTVNVLQSFTIDFGLCMFCGICVDVCPTDALHWAGDPHQAANGRAGLLRGIPDLMAGERPGVDERHSHEPDRS